MNATICLNADLGELPGEEGRQLDRAMLDVVTRCNIACGGHAGDAASMAATVEAALARGVLIGAHPSYPDRENFGRSRNGMPVDALRQSLLEQVRALQAVAEVLGAEVVHLKPHGALYNEAAHDADLAKLVVDSCLATGIHVLLGPPNSEMSSAADAAGLNFIAEGFADRSYEADGRLTPRILPGAVITDPAVQLEQGLGMVLNGAVKARTGETIRLPVATLCLHGDTPGAASHASALRDGLIAQGIGIRP